MNRNATKLICVVSFIISIVAGISGRDAPHFQNIYILPFLFSITQFFKLCIEDENHTSIVSDLMTYVGAVRYSLAPLIYLWSGCTSKVTNYSVFVNDQRAIIIQSYEMIAIWIVCYVSVYLEPADKKTTFGSLVIKSVPRIVELNRNAIFEILIIYVVVFMGCIIMYPSLLNHFSFIWNVYDLEATRISNVPSIFYALSQISINGARVTAILYFVKKIDESNIEENKKIFRLVIVSIVSILVVSDNRAYTFFYAIALLISIMVVYPNSQKVIKLIFGGMLGIALFLLVGIASKSYMSSESPMGILSQTLQSYFQGSTNVAVALCLEPNDISRMIPDIGKSVTGIAYFFQSHEDIKVGFNKFYYYNSLRSGQIIPYIGEGYVYFGFLLSPILSCFVLRNAFKSARGVRFYDNLDIVFIQVFKTLIAVISLAMYTFTIYVSIYASMIIPMIITYLYSKFRYKS